jgi:hypothetical protein
LIMLARFSRAKQRCLCIDHFNISSSERLHPLMWCYRIPSRKARSPVSSKAFQDEKSVILFFSKWRRNSSFHIRNAVSICSSYKYYCLKGFILRLLQTAFRHPGWLKVGHT